MDDMRFGDMMQRERERLNHERDEILNQLKELESKLAEINLELTPIDAYEAVKTGKAAMPTRRPPAPRKGEATVEELPTEPHARPQPGTRREALLRVIGEHPTGLSRGEIFERMSLKGNKSAEKSVSNALTALTKNNLVFRRDGKYVIGERRVAASMSGDLINNERHAKPHSKEGSA